MKRLKLKKEVKKNVKKIILTICLANVFLIFYRILGEAGHLATTSNLYTAVIALGWLMLFVATFGLIGYIWEE